MVKKLKLSIKELNYSDLKAPSDAHACHNLANAQWTTCDN